MRRAVLLLAVVLLGVGFRPAPTFALAGPDSISIESIKRYDDVALTGDVLVTVEYVITYGAVPPESVNTGWLGRLLDGSGQLASVQPFAGGVIPNSGYSRGMFSFYLSAPAITGALSVALQGNPSLSPAPAGITSASVQAQETADLVPDIRLAAQRMENDWGETLLTPLGGTIKFTTDGEDYFANVIPNLSAYAPELFIFSASTPGFEEDPHPATAITDRKALLDGTAIDGVFSALSDYTGASQELLETIVVLLLAAGVAALVMGYAPEHNEIAIWAVVFVAPLGGGMLGLGNWYLLGGLFSFLAVIALGWTLWGKRMG